MFLPRNQKETPARLLRARCGASRPLRRSTAQHACASMGARGVPRRERAGAPGASRKIEGWCRSNGLADSPAPSAASAGVPPARQRRGREGRRLLLRLGHNNHEGSTKRRGEMASQLPPPPPRPTTKSPFPLRDRGTPDGLRQGHNAPCPRGAGRTYLVSILANKAIEQTHSHNTPCLPFETLSYPTPLTVIRARPPSHLATILPLLYSPAGFVALQPQHAAQQHGRRRPCCRDMGSR